MTARVVVAFRLLACRRPLVLEGSMTILENLIVVGALLMGGASLAVAQNGPATGGQPTARHPAAPGPAASIPARNARHHGARNHRVYMMSVNRAHKGSKLTPASNAKPLSEWLHRP
jgi:hypothetical protein